MLYKKPYRNFKTFDRKSFRNHIYSQNWELIKDFDNQNHMWHVWKTTFDFNDVVDRHASLRTRRAWSSKSPWVTPVLRQRMREIDMPKIKAIQPKDLNHYKFAFTENEGDKKKTWGNVNELTPPPPPPKKKEKKKTHIKEIEVNGTPIIEIRKMYEFFNEHFATTGPNLHVS